MDNGMMWYASHIEELDRITDNIITKAQRGITNSSVEYEGDLSSDDLEYIRNSLGKYGIDISFDGE